MKRIILGITAILFVAYLGQAQSQKDESPRWVKMMNDKNVNFYDVQTEFNNYWQGKHLEKAHGGKFLCAGNI